MELSLIFSGFRQAAGGPVSLCKDLIYAYSFCIDFWKTQDCILCTSINPPHTEDWIQSLDIMLHPQPYIFIFKIH